MKVKRGIAAGFAAAMLLAPPSSAQQPSSPSKKLSSSSPSPSPDSLFSGPEANRNLVVVGRYLAADDTRLSLAATFLARGAAALRASGEPDVAAELVLAETAEKLAGRPGAPPEGVKFVEVFDPARGARVRVYDGEAFRRVAGEIPADADDDRLEIRERAITGALRVRFAVPGTTLIGKWEEAVAWLAFAESVRTPRVAEGVSRRLARAAPELARLLLAAGKLEDLAALDARLTDASVRLEALEPDPAKARRLRDAARAVRALRGNGRPPAPQEAWITPGPGAAIARIEGAVGALALVVTAAPDAPAAARARRVVASPLLPVPGSFALTADRKAATWIEAETPTRLVRVAYALDGSGPVAVTDRDSRAGSSSPRKPSRPPRRTGR